MFPRVTRLEFMIVAVALLVLLFCSQPPKSGNADIQVEVEETADEVPAAISWSGSDNVSLPDESASRSAAHLDVTAPDTAGLSGADAVPPTAETPVRTERMGVVDARNCGSLNYRDVMYGKVSVRWVWDGQKLVPHKVCVVEESNGVSTVWSFDQQQDVVLSEVQAQTNPSP
jgi:hypothetical protein